MNDQNFVEEFYKLKESLIENYFSGKNDTAVSQLIENLQLSLEKKEALKKVMDISLTDALYTILLGLEGSASIGDKQEHYKLYNEAGDELTGKGIEEYAWELFQNQ